MAKISLLTIFLLLVAATGSVTPQGKASADEIKIAKVKSFQEYEWAHFSPSGSQLALSGDKGVVIVQNPSGKIVCTIAIQETGMAPYMAFLPDGRTLAVSYFSGGSRPTDTIALYSTTDCQKVKTLATGPSGSGRGEMSISADGRYLVGNIVADQVWDIQTGGEVFRRNDPLVFETVAPLISPDGRWLISSRSAFNTESKPSVFEATDLETKKSYVVSDEKPKGFRFSSDSSLLFVNSVYVGDDPHVWLARLRIYQVGSWKLLRTLDDTRSTISFDVCGQRNLFASGTHEGRVEISSLAGGPPLGHAWVYKRTFLDDLSDVSVWVSFVHQVEFSPDCTMLVTGGPEGYIRLWRLELGRKGPSL